MIKGVAAAVIAGIAGAAAWAAVSHFTGYEVGFIAWGIGLIVGIGMIAGAGKSAGTQAGIAAAIIAVVAVVGGKYATVQLALQKLSEQIELAEFEISEHDMLVQHADEVVTEWEAEGRRLEWPEGMTIEGAHLEEHYPTGVWTEAEKRWEALGAEAQQADMAQLEEEGREAFAAFAATAQDEAFVRSFGLFDLLWFGLAVLTAFKVGTGSGSE